MANEKPKIVISAVNLTEAGPLSILRDCLAYAGRNLTDRYEVVALVHDASLVDAPGVSLLEFPAAKRSWFLRLYREYLGFRALSRRLAPRLWLSLHDMTPTVHAERRAVYCHNPSPFYRLRAREALLEPRFALFVWLYGLLYSINLRANRFVVVQQDWMRREFQARFGVNGVIVAHPEVQPCPPSPLYERPRSEKTLFVYPTHPRVFKNIEIIGKATRLLRAAGVPGFEVNITIDGKENRYARHVAGLLRDLPEIRLIGRQSRDEVFALYANADCLLFPSRLETWGLPITEFKAFAKPMLVAEGRYAAETVGEYENAAFFNPEDAPQLASLMRSVIEKRFRPEPGSPAAIAAPYARNWAELFAILLEG